MYPAFGEEVSKPMTNHTATTPQYVTCTLTMTRQFLNHDENYRNEYLRFGISDPRDKTSEVSPVNAKAGVSCTIMDTNIKPMHSQSWKHTEETWVWVLVSSILRSRSVLRLRQNHADHFTTARGKGATEATGGFRRESDSGKKRRNNGSHTIGSALPTHRSTQNDHGGEGAPTFQLLTESGIANRPSEILGGPKYRV